MVIYPAIDLMEGQAVRLRRGDRATREVVGDPLDLAARFAPAPLLHVVDLDGAFAGRPRQFELIAKLAAMHAVEAGGGVRTMDDVTQLLDAGVERVVLGTSVVSNPGLIDEILSRWDAERVVAALDVKDGWVATSGWTESSDLAPEIAAVRLAEQGVRWILCTATHRDGTLEGPDLSVLERVRGADPRLSVIASGGIGVLADVQACRDMAAVVVGKALYAGRFTLEEAMAC
jgi:phosphoribosylformimino-5-aminoimidazole carboxamide ribotide isomerase